MHQIVGCPIIIVYLAFSRFFTHIMSKRLWSREELVVTLALYFKLPFDRLNHTTKEVIELARTIGRTANSVALRLSNFAACDPYIINSGRHGMPGGLSICKPIRRSVFTPAPQVFLPFRSK